MSVFISWSGERSKSVASALKILIQGFNSKLDPWVSYSDIAAGAKWKEELDLALESATFGVVCASRLTLRSPWVLFEMGALSTKKSEVKICPYLIDVKPADVQGPLSIFQSREANKEGTWDLLMELNKELKKTSKLPARDSPSLKKRFDKHWPEFEKSVHNAPLDKPSTALSDYNRLDEYGLTNLLNIHLDASIKRLAHIFDQVLEEPQNKTDPINPELLVTKVKNIIEEGRLLLAPFYADLIGPVPAFLDECLPDATLQERIRQIHEKMSTYNDPESRRRAFYQFIEEEQIKLKRIIREHLTTHLSSRKAH